MCQWVKVWVAVTTVRATTLTFTSLDPAAICKKETVFFTGDYTAAQQLRLMCTRSNVTLHPVVKNS